MDQVLRNSSNPKQQYSNATDSNYKVVKNNSPKMYSLNIPYRSFSMKKREQSFEKSYSKNNQNRNDSMISINQNLEVNEFNPFTLSSKDKNDNQNSIILPRDSIATNCIVPQYREQMKNNQILNNSFAVTDVSTKVTAPTTINKNSVNSTSSTTNEGTNNEVLSRIKINLGMKTNATNKELINLSRDLLRDKEIMDKFFIQLRSVALEFTSMGYFREKVPGPKSLWRW